MAGHFSEFGLLPEICESLQELNWNLPTDIQAESIPLILGGTDVLMAAETGTGKTGAFAIPVIQLVHEQLCASKASHKEVSKNDIKMSIKHRQEGLAINPDGLLCQSRSNYWQGCKCEIGVNSGKTYFEMTVTDEGLCRVGWITSDGCFDVGTDQYSYGYGGSGKKSHKKQFEDYGKPYFINDTIGCMIDFEGRNISFSLNGNQLGVAFKIDQSLYKKTFYPAITLKNAECILNFGARPFKFNPPLGYIGLFDQPLNCLFNINNDFVSVAKREKCSPIAIVLEPSKELATQVMENINILSKHIVTNKPKSVAIFGKTTDYNMSDLTNVDILVGTISKINDLMDKNIVNSQYVKYLIIDEADALLKMSMKLVYSFKNRCGSSSATKKIQLIICSATLHNKEVGDFAEKYCPHAMWVDLKGMDSIPDTVHHVVCRVDADKDQLWQSIIKDYEHDGVHDSRQIYKNMSKDYLSYGTKLLKVCYIQRAILEHQMDQVIVFCRTKLDCNNLEKYFTKIGGGRNVSYSNQFSCRCLHSDLSQEERFENLRLFQNKKIRILICTCVAARGLDVQGVPYVICVTLPDDVSNFVHMTGRVGRAERMGLAISLVSVHPEKMWYHRCGTSKCQNTKTHEEGGCCVWYNELQLLGQIESNLMETIDATDSNFKIPINEFDGKVVYGAKRRKIYDTNVYNTLKIYDVLRDLEALEKQAQDIFLTQMIMK